MLITVMITEEDRDLETHVPSNRYKRFWRFSRPEDRNNSRARSQSSGGGRFHYSSQHREYYKKKEESHDNKKQVEIK